MKLVLLIGAAMCTVAAVVTLLVFTGLWLLGAFVLRAVFWAAVLLVTAAACTFAAHRIEA